MKWRWSSRVLLLALAVTSLTTSAYARSAGDDAQAKAIADVVRQSMEDWHLRAVIVKVTRDGRVIAEQAFGTSMDGVEATTDMHFRNGAVAFAYLATLLLRYVDRGEVSLDDTIERWEPDLPSADKVTLKMLTNQTTGYPDYEKDPKWEAAFNADPFHIWTYEERLKYAFKRRLQFAPGTNWSYAHTNFMILGEILAKIGGRPLDELLQDEVLRPMGLFGTVGTVTSEIPSPALHTYSSERRVALGIPSDREFYEDATFWNTQWGTPMGANQTTTIDDLATTAEKVGTGELLSDESYEAMTGPNLLGFGRKMKVCEPSCFKQIDAYNFGLGVVRSGSWILQNPLLSGIGATEAYLPSERIAIALAVTLEPAAFDDQGNYNNRSDYLFRRIGAVVAPDDPPPPLPE
jgi:CubicO group peptidase (beta-lactamase class C family)